MGHTIVLTAYEIDHQPRNEKQVDNVRMLNSHFPTNRRLSRCKWNTIWRDEGKMFGAPIKRDSKDKKKTMRALRQEMRFGE